jgi:hypothetical protein
MRIEERIEEKEYTEIVIERKLLWWKFTKTYRLYDDVVFEFKSPDVYIDVPVFSVVYDYFKIR